MRKEKMMNLDLGSDGDVQYISWKAQEQTWDVDGEKCELKQFLIAPDSIKIGQGKLEKGQSPIWKWNDTPGSKVKIDKDSGFKKAFFLMVYLSEKQGSPISGWREWISNQRASRDAVSKVFDQMGKDWAESKKAALIEYDGHEMMEFGPAKVAVPKLKFVKFVDAPEMAPAATENDDNKPEFE